MNLVVIKSSSDVNLTVYSPAGRAWILMEVADESIGCVKTTCPLPLIICNVPLCNGVVKYIVSVAGLG
jgi:hypothetical protein